MKKKSKEKKTSTKLKTKLVATLVAIISVVAVMGVGVFASLANFSVVVTNGVNISFFNLSGTISVSAESGTDNLGTAGPKLNETILYSAGTTHYTKISVNDTAGENLKYSGANFLTTEDDGITDETKAGAVAYTFKHTPVSSASTAGSLKVAIEETSKPTMKGGELITAYFVSTNGSTWAEITSGIAVTPVKDNQELYVLAICQYHNQNLVATKSTQTAWNFNLTMWSAEDEVVELTYDNALLEMTDGLSDGVAIGDEFSLDSSAPVRMNFNNISGTVSVSANTGANDKAGNSLSTTNVHTNGSSNYSSISSSETGNGNLNYVGVDFLNEVTANTEHSATVYEFKHTPATETQQVSYGMRNSSSILRAVASTNNNLRVVINETAKPEISGAKVATGYFISQDGNNWAEIRSGEEVVPVAETDELYIRAICQYSNPTKAQTEFTQSSWGFELEATSVSSSITNLTYNNNLAEVADGLSDGIALEIISDGGGDDLSSTDAGLYDSAGTMVASWDELVNTYGMNIESDYDWGITNQISVSLAYIKKHNSSLQNGTKLVIDKTVTRIGDCALMSSGLKDIIIPDSVISIGGSAFQALSSLENVSLGSGVKTIGSSAFSQCDNLNSIFIPSSVNSIGSSAFNYCDSLSAVLISNLESWCNIDFGNVESNPLHIAENLYLNNEPIVNLEIPNGITEIKEYAFYNAQNITGTLTLCDSVTTIGRYAFYDCAGLVGQLIINEDIININEDAFYGCSGFTSLKLKNPVYNYPFNIDTTSIDDIYVPEGLLYLYETSPWNGNFVPFDAPSQEFNFEYLESGLYDAYGNLLVDWETLINTEDMGGYDLNVEQDYTSSTLFSDLNSPYNLFRNYFGGKGFALKIDDAVTKIGDFAFYMTNLHYIHLGSGLQAIGDGAFNDAPLCGNLSIPNGVIEIGLQAFDGCTGLTGALVLPNTVTNIGSAAIRACSSLSSITLQSSTFISYEDLLSGCTSIESIYVPANLLYTYKTASGWNSFANMILPYDLSIVTTSCPAGGEHFYRTPGIYTADGTLIITWNELVQNFTFDIQANYNNTLGNASNYLTNTKSLQYIIKTHFANECASGVIISIGNVSSIGDYVFFGMDSSLGTLMYSGITLVEVIIPSSVTSIGNNAFAKSANTKFLYNGTQTQWDSITLGDSWNDGLTSPMVIHCTNGDKEIEITEDTGGGTTGCVSADTMVLLADGTTKRIDEITYDDTIMVWNFVTGTYDSAPVSIIFYHGHKEHDILNLKFSDGTVLKVINDHGLYSVDENNYVYISIDNVNDYIGQEFVRYNGNSYTTVTLVEYYSSIEYTGSYCLQTAGANNYIADGMFSLTKPDVAGWFDYFAIGDDMKYDEDQMQADIEKYGLYTYEDFDHTGITYEQFLAFNGPYLKVLVGRGVLTFERIEELIGQYL